MRNAFRTCCRVAVIAVATAVAQACSDNGTTTSEPPTLTLSIATSTASAARGTSATYSIGVIRGGSFTGTVALTAEGMPTGMIASFAPASVPSGTASALLTLDVGTTTPAGTHTITVRAKGTGVSDQITQVTLVVPSPAIGITLGNTTASLVQGSAITVPLTITRINGFSGPVDLIQSGAIPGVTVTFAPATIAATGTTSTMTVTAAFGSSVGTSNITVAALGTDAATSVAQLQLTITPGEPLGFTMTTTPAAFNVVAGGSVTSNIAITRQGGFSAGVGLVLEGAPAGVTSSFSPNPINAATSTLTIVTAATVTPGTYSLTVRASSIGLLDRTSTITLTVATPPGIALAVTPNTLSIPQSQSRQATVVATRLGGLTGDITMLLDNAPAGVTGTFSPNPATGTNSVLTLAVATETATGVYTLTVRGRGANNVMGAATLTLTVTPATYSLSATPSTISLQQGQTGLGNIVIARDAGFDGAVILHFTELPPGVGGTLSPATVIGSQSLFSLAMNLATPVGTYTITVIGQATGRADQTLTFTLVVTQGNGGPIAWKFCDASRVPLWFGYRDGASGIWSRLNGDAENVFTVPITQAVGNVAYVYEEGVLTKTDVFEATAAELRQLGAAECAGHPLAGKTVSGVFSGVSGADQITVSMGGVTAFTSAAQPSFTLNNVITGLQDLFATRFETIVAGSTVTRTPSRMLLRRAIDIPNNGVVPIVDFNSSESFVPGNSEITLANGSGEGIVVAGLMYTGTAAPMITFTDGGGIVTTRPFFGVPGSLLQAADLQSALATATNASGARTVQSWFRTVDTRTLTFGPALTAPTITNVTSAGSIRPRARGPMQAEYGDSFTAQYSQPSNRVVTITATRGYFGSASEYDLDAPDLLSASGFLSDWTLLAGSTTSVVVRAAGASTGTFGVVANGTTWRSGASVLSRIF